MDTPDIDWTVVFRALADDTRRSIMQYLVRTKGSSSVDEIVAELDGRNGPGLDEPTDAADSSDLHIRLLHVHLPALVDAELVRWTPGSDEVITTALASRIPAVLITPRVLMGAEQAPPEEASD